MTEQIGITCPSEKKRNSATVGTVGLGKAINYFTELGKKVCTPLSDAQPYDLVVDSEDNLYKIEVKTTFRCSPKKEYVVSLGSVIYHKDYTSATGSKYETIKISKKNSDFVFIYCENGDQYIIPTEIIDKKTSIVLNKKYQMYRV